MLSSDVVVVGGAVAAASAAVVVVAAFVGGGVAVVVVVGREAVLTTSDVLRDMRLPALYVSFRSPRGGSCVFIGGDGDFASGIRCGLLMARGWIVKPNTPLLLFFCSSF